MAKHKVPSIKHINERNKRIEEAMGKGLEEFGNEMKELFKEFKENLTPEQLEAIKNGNNTDDN